MKEGIKQRRNCERKVNYTPKNHKLVHYTSTTHGVVESQVSAKVVATQD